MAAGASGAAAAAGGAAEAGNENPLATIRQTAQQPFHNRLQWRGRDVMNSSATVGYKP
jgi:hypothetical protein